VLNSRLGEYGAPFDEAQGRQTLACPQCYAQRCRRGAISPVFVSKAAFSRNQKKATIKIFKQKVTKKTKEALKKPKEMRHFFWLPPSLPLFTSVQF
jgi:hypothetical protein